MVQSWPQDGRNMAPIWPQDVSEYAQRKPQDIHKTTPRWFGSPLCCVVISVLLARKRNTFRIRAPPSSEAYMLLAPKGRRDSQSVNTSTRPLYERPGGIDDVIKKILTVRETEHVVSKAGFLPHDASEWAAEGMINQERQLAQVALESSMHVARHIMLVAMRYSDTLPQAFLQLVDASDTQRWGALQKIKEWFTFLCEAEECARSDIWMKHWLRDLMWPDCTFVREILIMLYEANFDGLTAEIIQQLEGFAQSFLSSHIDETCMNLYRTREKESPNHAFSRASRYHTAATSTLIEEYDRNPVRITDAAKSITSAAIPPHCFTLRDVKKSCIGEDRLRSLSEFGDFPRPSPQSANLIGPAWRAGVMLRDARKLKDTWLSLLAEPGTFLVKRHRASADRPRGPSRIPPTDTSI